MELIHTCYRIGDIDRSVAFYEALEVERLDDDRVLGVVKFKGTATSTGMEVEQIFGQVFTMRDGKVAEMRSYSSKEQALAAVAETEPTD